MGFWAFGYGLLLGGTQFFLLKALLGLALAGGARAKRRLPLLLVAKLAVYTAAVVGALYLFGDALGFAGLGLGAGLVGMAVLAALRGLRQAKTSQDKNAGGSAAAERPSDWKEGKQE